MNEKIKNLKSKFLIKTNPIVISYTEEYQEKDKRKTKNDAAGLDDGWRNKDELQRVEEEIIKPTKLASMESKTCSRTVQIMMMMMMMMILVKRAEVYYNCDENE